MSISKKLGTIKIWQSRLTGYVSMINFAMLLYLYIIESPLGLEWYHWVLLMIVSCSLVIFIDVKYIFPEARLYTFKKDPGLTAIKKQVEENNRKLKLILEHLEIEDECTKK